MKTALIRISLLLAFISIITSCTSTEQSQAIEKSSTDTKANPLAPMKIGAFNDVNELVSTLSKNGIGNLKPWQNPMDAGYGSLTDYYPIGNPPSEYGLANNLAYYLEGTETQAKTLLINLNINIPIQKKQALTALNNLAVKTFKSLDIPMPLELTSAIKRGEPYEGNESSFTVSFSLEKSKIETWKVSITSK